MIRCRLFFYFVTLISALPFLQGKTLTKLPKDTDTGVVKFLELLSFSKDVTVKEPLNSILVERMACVNAASLRDPFAIGSEHSVEIYGVTSKPGMVKLSRKEAENQCKGMMLARMVHLTVGDQMFQQGLKKFTDTLKDKAATTDDLWSSFKLDNAGVPSGVTLKQIMDSWTDNTGYPVVTVTRDQITGDIKLQQKRFMGDPLVESKPETQSSDTCWWIPVTFTTAKSPDFTKFEPKGWLGCDKGESEVTLKTDAGKGNWVILNNQFSVPYHVNYDQASWKLIIATLKDDNQYTKIHVLNRAQLVNDVISLAYTNELDYRTTFGLLNYLKNEEEIIVWKFFFINIKKFSDLLIRTYMQFFDPYREHLRDLMNHVFEKTYPDKNALEQQINENKHMDDEDALWKAKFIYGEGCYFKVKKCMEYSKSIFAEWKTKDATPKVTEAPQQELMAQVLCTAAREGDKEEYEFIFNHMIHSEDNDPNRNIYIETVTCTFNHFMLDEPEKLLDWSTKKTTDIITPKEKETIYIDLVHSWIDFAIQSKFFYSDFDQIRNYHTPEALAHIIHEFAMEMNKHEFEKLKSFLNQKEVGSLPEVEAVLQDAAPSARFRTHWNRNYMGKIVDGYRYKEEENVAEAGEDDDWSDK